MSVFPFAFVVLLLGLADARRAQDAHLRPKRQAPTKYNDQTLTEMSGEFVSPNYPDTYPQSVEKTYIIKFPDPDAYYKVTFDVIKMGIELQSSCSWDYLLINTRYIPKLCGNKDGKQYTIPETQGLVTAKFYSDYIIPDRGFDIVYTLEKLSDGCTDSPCNNGTCTPSDRYDYTCSCPEGYTGNKCQYYNECLDKPCKNDGMCVNYIYGSYYCSCTPDFEGTHCDVPVSKPCDSHPCLNNGSCYNYYDYQYSTNYSCDCASEFTGYNCGVPVSKPCDSHPCLNNGSCYNYYDYQYSTNYSCDCASGFSGYNCGDYNTNSSGNGTSSNTTDACSSYPCYYGSCYNMGSDSYYCMCYSGYIGSNCQYYNNNSSDNGTTSNTTDACSSYPCYYGSCYNMGSDSYYCMCYSGYTGSNCQYYNNNSSDNGTTSNTTDACSSYPCYYGSCYNMGSDSYYCMCYSGYTGSNCQYYNNNSSGNGTSSNTTDACSSYPCYYGSCYNMGSDSYYCMCYSGYTGSNCQYYNNNSSGNGTSSNTTDACSSYPCYYGSCHNMGSDSYYCMCYSGYTGSNCQYYNNNSSGNGTSSNTTDACSSYPCYYGSCYNMGSDSYYCMCYSGYTGSNCQYYNNNSSGNGTSSNTTDACSSYPCYYGSCHNMGSDSYYCMCYSGYTGSNCQYYNNNSSGNGTSSNTTDACSSYPCYYGSCYNMGSDSYYCMCYSGYTGSNCQYYMSNNTSENGTSSNSTMEDVDECMSNPCVNGYCTNTASSYYCDCWAGYYGSTCKFLSPNQGNSTSGSPSYSLQNVYDLLQLAVSHQTSAQEKLDHLQEALKQLEQLIKM